MLCEAKPSVRLFDDDHAQGIKICGSTRAYLTEKKIVIVKQEIILLSSNIPTYNLKISAIFLSWRVHKDIL